MPSFFSKVFGRNKRDEKGVPRPPSSFSLLDGKFEAVSPPVSPTAINFLAAKGEDRGTFALFRTKSGPSADASIGHRDNLPHLSLNLPGPKDESNSRALGVVFEADPDGQTILPDSVIGERRLNPLEALILVRACSQAIATRGLETLGIMHPHWYSASPDIQRKLISLFIQSLAPKTPITTLSPTPTAAVSAFESELNFTRSPHDVAAVLRWGLRHLKLEGNSLGKEQDEWSWYKNFSESERSSAYSPKGFSENLVPQLPPAHLELLCATLEMISSLAAHAEANSISGSKLSKFLGLWLLSTKRSDEKDNWSTLYARWERAGRILEHLFLSRIRDEAVNHRMPTRLLELVRHYPYNKGTPPLSAADDLLSRPRFSTRQYDALFIRIDTELSPSVKVQQKQHPVRLIAEAFKSEPALNGGERYGAVWDKIKKTASESTEDLPSPDGFPTLSRIFADETIRFLSLVPADAAGKEPSSTFNLFSRKGGQTTRRRSFSLGDKDQQGNGFAPSTPGSSSGHSKFVSTGTAVGPGPSTGAVSNDWNQFSTSGFLETTTIVQPLASTLYDDEDVERTVPVIQRPSKKRSKGSSPASTSYAPAGAFASSPGDSVKLVSKSTMVDIVQLDEAFVDFWSDALLDPISSSWPTFVICKLKNSLAGLEVGDKCIDWIIIEQTYSRPPPQAPHLDVVSPESSRKSRAASPKPSVKSDLSTSRLSSTFSATRKRFSFFAGRTSFSDEFEKTTRGRKKMGISPKIGEMGEVLSEEEEKSDTKANKTVSKKGPETVKSNGHGFVNADIAKGAVVKEKSELEPAATGLPDARKTEASTPLPDVTEAQSRGKPMADIFSNATMESSTVINKPDEVIADAPKLPANQTLTQASLTHEVLKTVAREDNTGDIPSIDQGVKAEMVETKEILPSMPESVLSVNQTHAIDPEADVAAAVTSETPEVDSTPYQTPHSANEPLEAVQENEPNDDATNSTKPVPTDILSREAGVPEDIESPSSAITGNSPTS